MVAVVVAAPWFSGGVTAPVACLLYGGVVAALFCWIGGLAVSPTKGRYRSVQLPVVVLPLGAALALGAFQLAPIGHLFNGRPRCTGAGSGPGVVEAFRPQARGCADEARECPTVSLYPAATRLSMVHWAMAAIVMYLGAVLFREARAHWRLLMVVAVNGAALAFVGIAQGLRSGGWLPWAAPHAEGAPFASFVNTNNAAGFLNLCLACGVGLVSAESFGSGSERPRGTRDIRALRGSQDLRSAGTHRRRWETSPLHWTEYLAPRRLAIALLVVLVVAGVLCTGSRGGAISMAVAGVSVLLIYFGKRGAKPAALLLAGISLVGMTLARWTGLGDDLAARLWRLAATCGSDEVRLPHWQDASRAVTDFWPFGTGLGTYRYAYLPYQTRLGEYWFYHAENQYLEALLEGGVAGLLLVLSTIALVFLAVLKLVGTRGPRASSAIGYAGLFALASQCLHSLVDFGLCIPANMLLFALICGAVSGASRAGTSPEGPGPGTSGLRSRRMALIVSAALACCGVLGLREASAAARAYAAVRGVPSLISPRSLEARDTDEAVRRLTRAAARRPDDAELRVRLADLWIYRYRLGAYRAVSPGRTESLEDGEHWQLTSVALLHQRANAYHRLGDFARLERLRRDPLIRSNLEPAVEHLAAAKRACPILPRIDLHLAALSFIRDPGSPSGEKHLRNAVHLTPGDPDVLYAAGALARQASLDELAYECWRRSLELGWRYKDAIVADVRSRMKLAAIIDRVLPDSPELLVELARTDYAGEQFQEERALLVARAKELVASRRGQLSEPEWHHFHAVAHELEGRAQESIASYLQALEADPFQIEWRLALAKLLEREGRIERAYEEAGLCTLLAPDRSDCRELLQKLNASRLRRCSAESRSESR